MFHETLHIVLNAGANMAMIVLPSAPLFVGKQQPSLTSRDIGHGVEAGRATAKLQ
jgi:hypothetical protein